MNEEWVARARELLVSLVLECERFRLEKEAYRAVLETADENPGTLLNWRTLHEEIVESPPTSVKEKFGADMLPVIDFAILGLPPADGQALLERARRLVERIQ